MEVIANQHVKHDGVLHEPETVFMLPDEVAERMISRGSVRDPKSPPPAGVQANPAASPAGATPPEPPREFSEEQRLMLVRAAIVTMVTQKQGIGKDGKPKVAELEEKSGVNTSAAERDAFFAELYPPTPAGDHADGESDGKDGPQDGPEGGEKKPSALNRLLGKKDS